MSHSPAPPAAAPPWYVVHCRPLKEGQAALVLSEALGLTVYVPQVLRPVRGQARPTPFFPGYLFAQADLGQVSVSRINATPAVLRLLDFGGGPLPVPAPVVTALREQLERLNSAGGLPIHNFQPGDAVWLKTGPLRGLQAVFIGPLTPRGRVQVLLEFLGRLQKVQVPVDVLEPTTALPRRFGERGTRGQGRRIQRAPARPAQE